MRVAVCDDDRETVRQVTEAIERFSKEYFEVAYKAFYSAEDAMHYYQMNGNTFDALITDIELHNMNGIELAKRVRDRDDDVTIFFLTAHRQYAIECFKPRPSDFWEKPLKYEDLVYGLKLALKGMRRNSGFVDVISDRITKRIKCSDIIYIEKKGRKTLLHTVSGSFMTNKSLSDFENELSPEKFVRIYQSYIINIAKIDHIQENKVKLYDVEEMLDIGRTYMSTLKRRYMKYKEGV